MKVVIYASHPLVGLGLEHLIISKGWRLTACHQSTTAFFCDVWAHRPDIIIIDPEERQEEVLDTLAVIRSQFPLLPVLIYANSDSALVHLRARKVRVQGFVNKCFGWDELDSALSKMACDPDVLIRHRYPERQMLPEDNGIMSCLTPRELTVMHYLNLGRSSKQIATLLELSEKTISTYKRSLMDKLGTQKLIDVLDFARRHHL